jgi:hypothetical protein
MNENSITKLTKNCFKKEVGEGGLRKSNTARCWWLTSVILATQEAEIRRITVQSQPRQIVREKKKSQKKGWWSSSRCRPQVQVPVQ